ncbi:MAG: LysR substrate-binding domain-containing protein, partial [Candidatus Korobacteraceae bacterium]
TVEERLNAKGIALPNVLDFVNIEGVKRAVEAGLGISVQPRVAIQREVDAGTLVAGRLADMDPEIHYVYISRKKQIPSAAQKAFVEMLTNMT